MYDFLRHRLPGPQYAYEMGQLRALAALGVDRRDLLRAYYRLFEGVSWADLLEQGRQWYRELHQGRRGEPPFIAAGLAALNAHQDAGHVTVLVSEAFAACLTPLAADLGADLVLCSEVPLDAAGRLTGEVRHAMTPAAKARAVAATTADLGADPRGCFGYGGHADGLALLRAVGRPAVVGSDPVLLARAHGAGSPVLPAATSR
jgi:phosphoserine phosphatase